MATRQYAQQQIRCFQQHAKRNYAKFAVLSLNACILLALCYGIAAAQDAAPTPPAPIERNNRSLNIVGGQPADAGEWPWQAFLHVGPYYCSGTLIHPEWIVTAAHCLLDEHQDVFVPSEIDIRLGEHDRTVEEATEQERMAALVLVHPEYDRWRNDNDIALIRLATPAMINRAVTFIHPISVSQEITAAATGMTATVTGWGLTSEQGTMATLLMEVTVPIVSNEVCNRSYGIITPNMLCAGRAEGGVDACQGDSGGPLVVPLADDTWALVGIVSFGFGCARPHFYGAYTRMSQYTAWLEEQIGPTLWQTSPNRNDPNGSDPDEEPDLPDKPADPSQGLYQLADSAMLDGTVTRTLHIAANATSTVTLTFGTAVLQMPAVVALTYYTQTVMYSQTVTDTQAVGIQLTDAQTTTTADAQAQVRVGFHLAVSMTATTTNTTTGGTILFATPVTVNFYYTDSQIDIPSQTHKVTLVHSPDAMTWSDEPVTLLSHDPEQHHMVATIDRTGYYVLDSQLPTTPPPLQQLYLPVIMR